MVGAKAAADAIARARRCRACAWACILFWQTVALACGLRRYRIWSTATAVSMTPWSAMASGSSSCHGYALSLSMEIRAQFEAFAATGLPLDHVNTHKHFHLHPTVLSLMLKVGREFGMRAMRLPRESAAPCGSGPWTTLVKAGSTITASLHNDQVIGIDSKRPDGRSSVDRSALEHLPDGVTEIYCHPAVRRRLRPSRIHGPAIVPPMNSLRCSHRAWPQRCMQRARCVAVLAISTPGRSTREERMANNG